MAGVWVRACEAERVGDERPLRVEVEGMALAIIRQGSLVRALSARCPHAAGPLDRGWLEEGELLCPLHRWRFRLDDGRCTTVRGERVNTFPCEVRGDAVWVCVSNGR